MYVCVYTSCEYIMYVCMYAQYNICMYVHMCCMHLYTLHILTQLCTQLTAAECINVTDHVLWKTCKCIYEIIKLIVQIIVV